MACFGLSLAAALRLLVSWFSLLLSSDRPNPRTFFPTQRKLLLHTSHNRFVFSRHVMLLKASARLLHPQHSMHSAYSCSRYNVGLCHLEYYVCRPHDRVATWKHRGIQGRPKPQIPQNAKVDVITFHPFRQGPLKAVWENYLLRAIPTMFLLYLQGYRGSNCQVLLSVFPPPFRLGLLEFNSKSGLPSFLLLPLLLSSS